MQLTHNDRQILKATYLTFLKNLKDFIAMNNFNSEEKINTVIAWLLKNGYFTTEQKMDLNGSYDYLGLPSELEDGIQVMTGVCCCRHANNITYNILKELEYKCKLAFFYVDKQTGTWHEKPKVLGNNHVTISIKQPEIEIVLDTYNDLAFSITDGKIKSIRQELTSEEIAICRKYNDQENIKSLAKALKRYYDLRRLGITHIYDEKYGEY